MQKDLLNIEKFHKCVAVILNLMYENFPNPVEIDTLYIESKDAPASKRALVNFDDEMICWKIAGNSVDDNPVKKEIIIYRNSIYYLRDEGYIRTANPEHGKNQRTFYECVLTSKGLSALGQIGVKEKISWGTLIHTAVREGKYKTLQDLSIKVLSGGFS